MPAAPRYTPKPFPPERPRPSRSGFAFGLAVAAFGLWWGGGSYAALPAILAISGLLTAWRSRWFWTA